MLIYTNRKDGTELKAEIISAETAFLAIQDPENGVDVIYIEAQDAYALCRNLTHALLGPDYSVVRG